MQKSAEKKAFLSIDKIITLIKNDDNYAITNLTDITAHLDENDNHRDQFGELTRYPYTLPRIIAGKMD